MDLLDIARILMRRWYIALPLCIATVAVALAVRAGVSPGYTVTSNVLVLPPSATRVQTDNGFEVVPSNPLLGFSGSTLTAAQALALLGSAPDFQERATEGSDVAAYSVVASERQPIITISVESQDRQDALDTGQRVIDELDSELAQQQPTAQQEQRLALYTLTSPAVTAADSAPLRALVISLAVGLLLTLAVSVLVDGILTRYRRPNRRGTTPISRPSSSPGSGDTTNHTVHEAGTTVRNPGLTEPTRQ
ncbi:hypothetical protein [Geodermatophilus sp. DSM 44513]|uniref:hypothetical protein n=1 Tax=Geodermatophilus sp. DSM 44513 TaxID=1528104 RepID=UPI00127F1BA5|nr:hypothetical protein [Geodermatophilus sp. DSM 44513]WNV76011.1 hypothetical protein RTG05_01750 [Geodermatophilus sp. DSM 44513]